MAAAAEEAKALLYAGKVEEAKQKAKDALAALEDNMAGRTDAAKTLITAEIDACYLEEAKEVMEAELTAFQAADFKPGTIVMQVMKSAIFLAEGKFDDSVAASRSGWSVAKKLGDKVLQAEVLVAMVAGMAAKLPPREALRAASSSMTTVEESGDKSLIAEMLLLTAKSQLEAGDSLTSPQEAVTSAKEALTTFQELGNKKGEALAMSTLEAAQSKIAAVDAFQPLGQDTDAQAGQGRWPAQSMKELEDEYAKLKDEEQPPQSERMVLEKMVSLASEMGDTLEAIMKLEQLIAVMQAIGDKMGEANKTLEMAEMCVSINHVRDAARIGDQAVRLFAALGDSGLEERAKKLATTCWVRLGEYSKAPYRSEAVLALKNFLKAVQARDIGKVKEFEAALDKASMAMKDSEVSAALEVLIGKDPGAAKVLEELGWDVSVFKTPQRIYQFNGDMIYAGMFAAGMHFGPTYRGNYPYRLGKASDPDGCLGTCINQMPETYGEEWMGKVMFRHGLMNAAIEGGALGGLPPR